MGLVSETDMHIVTMWICRGFWCRPGFITDKENLFNRIHMHVERHGLHTKYTYFGARRAEFPPHEEDRGAYSVNFLVAGAIKSWMAPAVKSNLLFHNIVREANPVEAVCPNYLAHKRVIIPIKYLLQMEIPICELVLIGKNGYIKNYWRAPEEDAQHV
nr:PREDICTED: DNA damage-responsive transcriptional repressor RPH1-like [Bemisia tabaci]